MPKPTIQSVLIAGLRSAGWTEVEGRSSRYRTFEEPTTRFLIFVGRSGALRAGRTVTTSSSLERTEFRARMLTAGTTALGVPPIDIPELDEEPNTESSHA